MQKNTYGTRGEIIASNYLISKGYTIVERNYKNKIGEIDIIAKQGNTIVFVEVKTRMSRGFGDPLEAVNNKKQQKIRNVATTYLMKIKKLNSPCRFDVVSILGDTDEDIIHIENAF